jgi:hypothetical protein
MRLLIVKWISISPVMHLDTVIFQKNIERDASIWFLVCGEITLKFGQ